MANALKLDLTDTPEKFRASAEEAAAFLTDLLGRLRTMEQESFAQYTRLCQKGRVIEFKDGVREEITDTQVWKERSKHRFAAFLDPYCTEKLLSQRRECIHAVHFPSSFNCIDTGCDMLVTMKSDRKAAVVLLPEDKAVLFDLTDPIVRYLVEDMKRSGHSAKGYGYFEKYRFILRLEDSWKIDEVFCSSRHEDRWKRDRYF